jgi:prepilin-type N-terminal cleavage/methylation domain-containing protein
MNNRAFTLIELLVVIAIIAIMSVFVLANFSTGTRQAGLAQETNNVLSFLRKARQNSLAILEHPDDPNVFPSYGVHIDLSQPDTLILFADCKADDDDSGSIDLVNDVFHFRVSACTGKGRIEELILENAEITDIAFDGIEPTNPSTLDSFNVLYIRPEPSVWFSGSDTGPVINLDAGEVRITVSNLSGTESDTIYLNSAGLIVTE